MSRLYQRYNSEEIAPSSVALLAELVDHFAIMAWLNMVLNMDIISSQSFKREVLMKC